MDADPVFLDTNVLIYATVAESPFHRNARQAIDALESGNTTLWISRQVLREYLAILSRPQAYTQPVLPTILAAQIRHFEQRFWVADEDETITAQLLELVEKIPVGGKQIHDANIVATMLVHHIPVLLTFNVADFDRFQGLVEVRTPNESQSTQ